MDLRSYPEDLQMLIVASSLRWVHEQEHEVISILPEAWKFAPQGRNTPVKLEVRKIAREGAGLKNYLWVDSQDIAGVEKEILRAAAVWMLGVQSEANEIERALSSIPKGIKRPKEGDVPTLRLGAIFCLLGRAREESLRAARLDESGGCASTSPIGKQERRRFCTAETARERGRERGL
jgi:hypothetical protein